ncbi:TRADD-N-associated membrane domain-containing protein [Nocardia camponoti]|uniref:Cyanobacterial TRADD-N associated 2 transmembrane domain-containing protein n=1 Tax=Nocardia camponoti TaxID=1616106 RepID=A0A917Q786_9NOCA|nr:hypothetical protein [Nocardia camponoti]GGK32619.1 hypothetical protein GCM10011591_00410 [Nocardia camponoti]
MITLASLTAFLPIATFMSNSPDGLTPLLIFGAVVAVIGPVIFWVVIAALEDSASKSAGAREALNQAVENVSSPNDLLKLMEVNRRQMEAYDIQARSQGRTSHWSSLLAMTAGLGIVAVGMWIAVTADETATKYAAAIIAAVGTGTGGYIAKTFIQVNTTAQQHVRFYFEQPLVQSYLLTAERVIERLPESERGPQYALVVAAALGQAGLVPELRNAVGHPSLSHEQSTQPDASRESPAGEL